MFLRWMIRRDSPVDLGIWRSFSPSDLIIPLDAHVHRISTDLGLTNARKCLKTARCITDALREIWPDDPVKGDFALFRIWYQRTGEKLGTFISNSLF